jgi:hypothetical protein
MRLRRGIFKKKLREAQPSMTIEHSIGVSLSGISLVQLLPE